MNESVKEKIETKLEKIAAMAKHQDTIIVKRGDVANDVRATLSSTQTLVEEIKNLIKIL